MEAEEQGSAHGTVCLQVQDLLVQLLQGQQREMDEFLWARVEEQAAQGALFGWQQTLNEKLEGRQGTRIGPAEVFRMP